MADKEPQYVGLQGILKTEEEAMGLYDKKKKQRVHMSSEESDCMAYNASDEESPEGADTENAHSKHNPKKAKGPGGKGKWMQHEAAREKAAGTKGALRRMTKTKEGHTIPTDMLQHLAKKGGLIGKRANMALRYRGR